MMMSATENRINRAHIKYSELSKKEYIFLDKNFGDSWQYYSVCLGDTLYRCMKSRNTRKTPITGIDRDLAIHKGMRLSLRHENSCRTVIIDIVNSRYMSAANGMELRNSVCEKWTERARRARAECMSLRTEIQELEDRLLSEAKTAAKTAALIRRALKS